MTSAPPQPKPTGRTPRGKLPEARIARGSAHKREVGQRLRLLQTALDLQQQQLAAAMGISPQNLARILAGNSYPAPLAAIRACVQFGVTLDWIFRGEPAGVRFDLAARFPPSL